MANLDNSVFISYRRNVSSFIARAVFQDLRANNINAFMDIESIDMGQFDTIILNQIAARPYFLLILTPGTLDRCVESGDWLVREIEHAMELKRNIIPLVTNNFSFDDAKKYLSDPIKTELPRWNAVDVPANYFEEAMNRLRTRFLKPIDLPLTPTPKAEQAAVERKLEQVRAEPAVTKKQLSAEEYVARGNTSYDKGDFGGAIADYSEAIRLNSQYALAYYSRGVARKDKGDLDGAIADYSEAIRLNPKFALAYLNRGLARRNKGDLDGAIADCGEAIHLNPTYALAYFNRGYVRLTKGDFDGAIADCNEAIRFNPKDSLAYNNRGFARYRKYDFDGAMADCNEAIRLDPQNVAAYDSRGCVRQAKGDFDGAIADYNKAIRLNPKAIYAYNNRATAHNSKKDYPAAVSDYETVLELNPNYPDAKTLREYIAKYKK